MLAKAWSYYTCKSQLKTSTNVESYKDCIRRESHQQGSINTPSFTPLHLILLLLKKHLWFKKSHIWLKIWKYKNANLLVKYRSIKNNSKSL